MYIFKLSRIKTKYMKCKFCSRMQRRKNLITIVGEEIAQTDGFAI